jgi:hypothetical protein
MVLSDDIPIADPSAHHFEEQHSRCQERRSMSKRTLLCSREYVAWQQLLGWQSKSMTAVSPPPH